MTDNVEKEAAMPDDVLEVVGTFLADLEKLGDLRGVVPEEVLSALASTVSHLEYVEQILDVDEDDPQHNDGTVD